MKRRELLTSLATGAVATTIAESAVAQSAEIVGTWKFLTYVRTDPVTGKNTNIFGEHPRGWLVYTAEGRMMVIVVPESRNEAWIGTDLVRSFRITGDRLIITTAPTKYGVDGVEQVSTLTLERAKSP